jgi:hypothetical protein
LPDKVHAVNVAVVQIEARLQRREVKVAARVATDRVVAAAVYSNADARRLTPPTISLHYSLEDLDILAIEDGHGGVAQRRPLVADVVVEVTLYASRIVAQRSTASIWAKIDRIVGERRALLEAAAARPGFSPTDCSAVALDKLAIAAK